METQNSGVAGDPSVIKLRVRDIAQLFNTLDASPFRIRDISPAVDQYIVDWAQELPQDQPIEIDVYLGSRDATERETSDISDAFRSWYTEKEKAETTAIRTLFRDARLSGPFARLMQESLVIYRLGRDLETDRDLSLRLDTTGSPSQAVPSACGVKGDRSIGDTPIVIFWVIGERR